MPEIKKILFPVELSDITEKIVPFVRLQAEAFGAEVTVLHVVSDLRQTLGPYHLEQEGGLSQATIIRGAENWIHDFCGRFLPQARRVVLMGDPVEKVVEYVIAQGISMVIMGSHGRKGLDRIVFGSVATRVVRRSPAPVLIVNPYLRERLAGGD